MAGVLSENQVAVALHHLQSAQHAHSQQHFFAVHVRIDVGADIMQFDGTKLQSLQLESLQSVKFFHHYNNATNRLNLISPLNI